MNAISKCILTPLINITLAVLDYNAQITFRSFGQHALVLADTIKAV